MRCALFDGHAMHVLRSISSLRVLVVCVAANFTLAAHAWGQGALGAGSAPTRDTLFLAQAQSMARLGSAELRAAREGVAAALGRERQAGARPDASLFYGREQTSRNGSTNSQDIAALEQPLEFAGQRGARIAAARYAQRAAATRLTVATSELDFAVTLAYATALAAERRVALAAQAAAAFTAARGVSEIRLASGDVSGYAARRVRLESARYAALVAEATLTQRTARRALAALVTATAARSDHAVALVTTQPLDNRWLDVATSRSTGLSGDSLRVLALTQRSVVRLADLEVEVAGAEARVLMKARLPVPVASAGFKREAAAGAAGAPSAKYAGFVAGLSIPLPLWDRRQGALASASAEQRRRVALADGVRRRVAQEVDDALEALQAADEQIALLQPVLARDARPALRAAQTAYGEGEISLVEWLDAVRAYHETESAYTTLLAERLIRRAALELAVGTTIN